VAGCPAAAEPGCQIRESRMTSPAVQASPAPADWRPIPDPTELTTSAVNAATAQFRRDLDALRELFETRLSAMDKATELLAATVNKVPSETDKAISAMKELIDTRLMAMDKANELLATGVVKDLAGLKEILTGEVRQTAAVSSERYESVKIIFDDHALALTAALTAQKEAAAAESEGTQQALAAMQDILQREIHSVQDVAQEKFTAIEGTFASNALALTAALAAQKEAAAEQNKSNTLAITKSEQATKETIAANATQTANSLQSQAATIADLKERLVRIESGGVATAVARTEQREVRGETRADRAGVSQIVMMIIAGISVMIAIISLVAFALKK
jgi:hypothetical protein